MSARSKVKVECIQSGHDGLLSSFRREFVGDSLLCRRSYTAQRPWQDSNLEGTVAYHHRRNVLSEYLAIKGHEILFLLQGQQHALELGHCLGEMRLHKISRLKLSRLRKESAVKLDLLRS